MKRMTIHSPGQLATVGTVALLCVEVFGSTGYPATTQTWQVQPVADRTEHHGPADGHDDNTSGHPYKSEPTHSGLRGHGLLP